MTPLHTSSETNNGASIRMSAAIRTMDFTCCIVTYVELYCSCVKF